LPRGFITHINSKPRIKSSHAVSRRALAKFLTPALLLLAFLMAFLAAGCKNQPSTAPETQTTAPRGSLELVFPYGSEKEKWINYERISHPRSELILQIYGRNN
jgi:hypothetical protein